MESPEKNEFIPDMNMDSKAEIVYIRHDSLAISKKQEIIDADLLEIDKRHSFDFDKEIMKEKFQHFYHLYLV